MNIQRRDTKKINLIEEGKNIGINEVIKHSEIINNSLKFKLKSYCLKCRKNTENINSRVSNTNNGKTMMLSKGVVCGRKKSRFIKKQDAKGLLSNLGLMAPLRKVSLLGDILF